MGDVATVEEFVGDDIVPEILTKKQGIWWWHDIRWWERRRRWWCWWTCPYCYGSIQNDMKSWALLNSQERHSVGYTGWVNSQKIYRKIKTKMGCTEKIMDFFDEVRMVSFSGFFCT
jgi:hypothetical protein